MEGLVRWGFPPRACGEASGVASSGRFLTPRGVVGSPACRGGRCGDIFGHELLSSVVGAPGHGSGRLCRFRCFSDDHVEDGGANTVTGDNALHGSVRTHDGYGRCRGSRREAADSMFWAQMTLTRSQTKISVSPPAMTPGMPCGPYARSWGMTSRRLPPTFMPCTPSSHPGIT